LKVALLEAGARQSDQNFSEHKAPFEIKYRDRAPEIVRKTRPVQLRMIAARIAIWYCFNAVADCRLRDAAKSSLVKRIS
jgi:hypothetical protein